MDCQGQQQPTAFHNPQIPPSPSHGKPSPTKTGRLIQPSNLLKALTPNVKSLSSKINELIALIQVENSDVIASNGTWHDTKNKRLPAEVAILQGLRQTNSNRKGRWINHVYQNQLKPNRQKEISYLHKGNYSS